MCVLFPTATHGFKSMQHGVLAIAAVKFLQKEIANAWTAMIEECLKPTSVPLPLLENVLNLARVIDVVYKDEDEQTNRLLTRPRSVLTLYPSDRQCLLFNVKAFIYVLYSSLRVGLVTMYDKSASVDR